MALLTVLAVAGLGRGARAEAVEAVEAVDGDGEREALAKREVIGWSWWSFVQAARKGKGGKGKAKNQRIGFNGRCPWNLAGSSYLCPLVNAPSSEPQLGSADGKWAFVFADGGLGPKTAEREADHSLPLFHALWTLCTAFGHLKCASNAIH